jgi:multidrug efflux pump subunit AcrA (membrane-fusion protein)
MKARIRKNRIYLVVAALLLVVLFALMGGKSPSAADEDTTTTQVASGVLEIETISFDQLPREVIIAKNSQLQSSSTITITSQAPGRVQNIRVRPGESLNAWRLMVSLSDTVGDYGIATQRAKTTLEGTQLQYAQSEIQLEKSIADAELAYQQSQNSYDVLQKQIEQQLRQGELNLTSTVSNLDSTLVTL